MGDDEFIRVQPACLGLILYKEMQEGVLYILSFCSFCPFGLFPCDITERRSSPGTQGLHLDLDFPDFRTERIKFLIFITPSLKYLLWQYKEIKITSLSECGKSQNEDKTGSRESYSHITYCSAVRLL